MSVDLDALKKLVEAAKPSFEHVDIGIEKQCIAMYEARGLSAHGAAVRLTRVAVEQLPMLINELVIAREQVRWLTTMGNVHQAAEAQDKAYSVDVILRLEKENAELRTKLWEQLAVLKEVKARLEAVLEPE